MVNEMGIFIDSNIFIAYANNRDNSNARARQIMEDIESGRIGPAFTSDYVFSEVVTVTQIRTKNKSAAKEIGKIILEGEITTLKINTRIFSIAWEMFNKDRKIRMSFTDFSNLALMKQLDIQLMPLFYFHLMPF